MWVLGIRQLKQWRCLIDRRKSHSLRGLWYTKWHKPYSEGQETIIDNDRCSRPVSKSKTIDVKSGRVISFPKLKDELKGKHFNDLDELRSESARILHSYPVEWFYKV